MNLLALDTSTELATVALSYQGTITMREQHAQREHAHCILGLAETLLREANATMADLEGIVFGQGPGSFTGLRIACSVAKGWAYAHDLPLFPVNGLQAIAAACADEVQKAFVLTMIDARMAQVYWAVYQNGKVISYPQVSAAQDILLPAGPVYLAGVGYDEYQADLPAAVQEQIIKAIPCAPHAQTMIELVQTGAIPSCSAHTAEPLYIRNQVTQGEPRG